MKNDGFLSVEKLLFDVETEKQCWVTSSDKERHQSSEESFRYSVNMNENKNKMNVHLIKKKIEFMTDLILNSNLLQSDQNRHLD